MAGKAIRELKQSKPFVSLHHECFVNIQITADAHLQAVAQCLKPHGLTPAQYNALRILRGAGPPGLPCGQIAERMITRDPDITRLLDRLESRGLVARAREPGDRRVVTVRVTQQARRVLARLDGPLMEAVRRMFDDMSDQKLTKLISLLEECR